jgi:hypothetical protein
VESAELEKRKDWTEARLLSTSGIRSHKEKEARAASALLAVLSAVPDFCHALLSAMKAPKGKISTYTEVRFKDEDEKTHVPDGAIVIERGKRQWGCLVEIKTGGMPVEAEQVSRYLDMARKHDFDGLLTISNQIRSDPKTLPYTVSKKKLKGLTVYHASWWRVLTEAIVQHRFRGIDDPDQAWILGELIRYLDDAKSGASGFEGMGKEWVRARESARNQTLRASDREAKAISARWRQFVEYLCLHLGQELGVDVKHHRPRGKSAEEQIVAASRRLAGEGLLDCSIRVPDAVGPIGVEANLRTRLVTNTVEIPAPREGRPKTRVNWLLRQLKDAPDELRIDVRFHRVHSTRSELLRDCRKAPDRLLIADEPKREPRAFVLALSKPMGKKGGRKDGSFVAETRRQTTDFYRDLVQGLVPPRTKAPKIRGDEEKASKPDGGPAPTREKSEGKARREQESSARRFAEVTPFLPE